MHTFYPSEFYWKQQSREPNKVAAAVKVLNTLTDEQKEAVLFYTNGMADEATETAEDEQRHW